jgi:hypothetical protein
MPGTEYTNAIRRASSDKFGEQPSVNDMGALPDFQSVSDANISASAKTLTSASGLFDEDDVNQVVSVAGAGAAGADLITTIASYTSSTEVELVDAASTTVSTVDACWGTDNTTALQAAINEAARRGVVLRLHFGKYLTGALTIPSNLHLVGSGKKQSWLIFKPGAATNNHAVLETVNIEDGPSDPYSATVSNIILRDFAIDGLGGHSIGDHNWQPDATATANARANGAEFSLLFLFYTKNVEVRDLYFTNANMCCISFGAWDTLTIQGCEFSDWINADVLGWVFADYQAGGRSYVYHRAGAISPPFILYGDANNTPSLSVSSKDLRILNNVFSGDVSDGSCIKIAGMSDAPPYGILISGNEIIVGGQYAPPGEFLPAYSSLGIELYGGDSTTGNNNILNFRVVNNHIRCLTDRNGAFGISVAGGPSARGVVSGNIVDNCRRYGIEIISRDLTIQNNYVRRGRISVVAFSDLYRIDILGNLVDTPMRVYDTETSYTHGIVLRAAAPSGQDGKTLEDINVIGNTIRLDDAAIDQNPLELVGISIETDRFTDNPYSIVRTVTVANNVISGTGATREQGILVGGPTISDYTDYTYDHIHIINNTFRNIGVGIKIQSQVASVIQNSRVVFNDIDAGSVTTLYENTESMDSTNLTVDTYAKYLEATKVRIIGRELDTLDSSGNIALPAETSYQTADAKTLSNLPADGTIKNPNIVSFPAIASTEALGVLVGVNSKSMGYPNHQQTSIQYAYTAAAATDILTITDAGLNNPVTGNTMFVLNNTAGGLSADTVYYVEWLGSGQLKLYTDQARTILVNISSDGVGDLTDCPYAMWMLMSPARFGIGFGDADDVSGNAPWNSDTDKAASGWMPFEVRNYKNMAGVPSSQVLSGVYTGYPIYPSYSGGGGITWYSSDPEGNVTMKKGSICLTPTALYQKTSEGGSPPDDTGWEIIGLWTVEDSDTIATEYKVHITDTSNTRPMQLKVTANAHASQGTTPLVNSGALKAYEAWVGVNQTTPVGSEKLGVVGTSRLNGNVELPAEIASRAVQLDASSVLEASAVTSTELGYVSGLTSALQTQLNALSARITTLESHTHAITNEAVHDHNISSDGDPAHDHSGSTGNANQHNHGGATGGPI